MTENQKEIQELISAAIQTVNHIVGPEGLDDIEDKGVTKETVLTDVVARIMDLAVERGFDHRRIVLMAVLRYCLWRGNRSETYKSMKDVIRIALED